MINDYNPCDSPSAHESKSECSGAGANVNALAAPQPDAEADRIRYSRQTILSEIGAEGQARLRAASVLIVGLGGLGSPAAFYLAAAGIGRLGLADFDKVDLTNLHRQILHRTDAVGMPKTDSARDRLAALNPGVNLEIHADGFTTDTGLELVRRYDVVLDCGDNFRTRYLVNDACVLIGKPDVSGSVFRFEGQAGVFWARRGPCYRCLYPDPPPPESIPNCAEAGVLGVLPGLIGTLQATEAIKLILGIGDPLIGRLALYDALAMRLREVRFRKDPNCAICGAHPAIRSLHPLAGYCGTACGDASPPADPADEIDATELHQRIDRPETFLLDVRQPSEWDIARLPGAVLIPVDVLPDRLNELPRDRDICIYCLSGGRSARALRLLRDAGFRSARHLRGGIRAWRETVDPAMPAY